MICHLKRNQGNTVLPLMTLISSLLLMLTACSIILPTHKTKQESKTDLQVTLHSYQQSNFKQVEATFVTYKSKELVFRVLSNIKLTPQWLDQVVNIEVLEVYNNSQYLLRTVINSPWPFKDREIITCVDTHFSNSITSINIYACSERVPINSQYQRVLKVNSSWILKEISHSKVEIRYKTWIDPEGSVPAFIFNQQLIDNTKVSFSELKKIIASSSLDDYPY